MPAERIEINELSVSGKVGIEAESNKNGGLTTLSVVQNSRVDSASHQLPFEKPMPYPINAHRSYTIFNLHPLSLHI